MGFYESARRQERVGTGCLLSQETVKLSRTIDSLDRSLPTPCHVSMVTLPPGSLLVPSVYPTASQLSTSRLYRAKASQQTTSLCVRWATRLLDCDKWSSEHVSSLKCSFRYVISSIVKSRISLTGRIPPISRS